MITAIDRRVLRVLIACKLVCAKVSLFRTVDFHARKGFGWILDGMKARQTVDKLRHAPCCPANHWHRQRLVFQRCNCGAAALARKDAQPVNNSNEKEKAK